MIVVMNILVIGAHPDDESIGAGGAIAKHIENGDTVFIVLFSVGHTPIQPKLKDQTYDMLKVFGIKKKNLFWLNCKSGNFDLEDKIKINSKLTEIINDIKPKIVYTHFYADTHLDHGFVFNSTMVACRPTHIVRGLKKKSIWASVEKILCYEIPSSTNWSGKLDQPFHPTEFNVISKNNLQTKFDAYSSYSDEVRPGNHPRSIDSLQSLAKYRGNSVGAEYAEAYVLIRNIIYD